MKTKKKSTAKTAGATAAPAHHRKSETGGAAREHYRREKAARAHRVQVESNAMAAARREYLAQLEAAAAKGRGGRPKKKQAVAKRSEPELFDDGAEESDGE
ncbi:MAG TPA: hypothetical protein VN651_17480 [Gemmatimonadaceae bacterium]|nr:hypothetical protein [Gemmatimonadaceae bacterium]